jgi:TolA-binding protein
MTRVFSLVVRAVPAAALLLAFAASAPAQSARITQADVQKLQDTVYLAERDISTLRSRDSGRAQQLQTELDDLSDEVIYLRVKLRKERTLAQSEYNDVQTRIEDVRSRAQGDARVSSAPAPAAVPAPAPAPAVRTPDPAPAPTAPRSPSTPRATASRGEIPANTELDARLSNILDSGTAMVEDRFEATTAADLVIDGRTIVPAGSIMRGVVSSVQSAGRLKRKAEMTVTFDQITINGRSYPIRGTVTQAIEGEGVKGDLPRAGVGAGVGAIIGGILGGFKGAMAGILIGGGGTIAATEGKEVVLPQGTVLRVRIEAPVPL